MPAFVLGPISTFAEALSRCKRLGLRKMLVGSSSSGNVRCDGSLNRGVECAEIKTMAHWLGREHWKRGDLFTARSLWNFCPSGFGERASIRRAEANPDCVCSLV